MDEILEEQHPEFYEIIPEYNAAGRLCNHGSGDNPRVRVPAEEWERFNRLAGRQHEIINGVVVFNPELEPCMPDDAESPDPLADLAVLTIDHEYRLALLELGVV